MPLYLFGKMLEAVRNMSGNPGMKRRWRRIRNTYISVDLKNHLKFFELYQCIFAHLIIIVI